MPIHVASTFYDVEAFKAGKAMVEPFEIDELGSLGERRLAHLQCHFGQDTLDLVRLHPTLQAVGLDFSKPAVVEAAKLAAQLGLDDRATFVQADVYDAVDALGQDAFDIVYTGKGALIWLPDLPRWASVCHSLLKPGGTLYLCEFHPNVYVLGDDGPSVAHDYFSTDPITLDDPGTYAEPEATTHHNLSYEWCHQISTVLESLIGAGFELRMYHEWEYTLGQMFPWLVPTGSNRWTWPGPGRLPLMYSLKAEKR